MTSLPDFLAAFNRANVTVAALISLAVAGVVVAAGAIALLVRERRRSATPGSGREAGARRDRSASEAAS